ncbi:MAG: entericidin [Paraburkholderia sp.]|jgi:entericidin A|uniref:entericidin A/B family lipoprotein n=1 Tax=Paraburkholderia sp. TaxID=1926495 RepID=UPI002AFF4068|nr:entericidin A/B family lipoprotein [Paraburkholderia sp.]MEA3087521.1 entericidin [Paraburkholderia sp.]HEX3638184.1 entericidin A/B family lipoprotein [Paraburkholderia sp.]
MIKNINRTTLLRRFALGTLTWLLLGLAGCNTVHGFGEDMSHLGNSISNHADK